MSYLEYKTPIYHSLEIHNLMLSDRIRTGTYAQAIRTNVNEGDVVVDVGAGTGILSLLAAKAGAKRVYAIEPTKIIEVAKRITKDNGLEDKIHFLNCTAEEAEIHELVDCIVSEWMGVFGIQENMLPAVTSVRDRYLKKDGKILPSNVSLYMALVSSNRIYDEAIGKWKKSFHGLDYSYFADSNASDTHLVSARPEELGSPHVRVLEIDCRNIDPQEHYEANARFVTTKNSNYHGVIGWFTADFPKGIVLDTSPHKPVTHWQQLFFPFKDPVKLRKDEGLNLTFGVERDKQNHGLMHFSWDLK